MSKIARVRTPDGRVARFRVADNVTPEQVLQLPVVQNLINKPKPKSFWQGVGEGITPYGANAGRILAAMNPVTAGADLAGKLTGIPGPTAAVNAAEKAAKGMFARSRYQGSGGGKIVGGMLGAAPTLAVPGGPIAQGAAGGFMGADLTDPRSVLRDTLIGAVAGEAGRLVAKPVGAVAAAVVRGGRNLLNTATGGAVERALPRITAAQAAVAAAIQKAGPEKVRATLQEAGRLNVPMTLADTHPELRELTGAAVRRSPTAAHIAETRLVPRSRAQIDRLGQAVERDLGPVGNIPQLSETLSQQARTEAAPLYKEAFEGGSQAPLETQFQEAFGQSGTEVAAAQRELQQALQKTTLAKAQASRAGENVYGANAANRAGQEADQAVAAAQRKLAAAQQSHEANVARLKQAQADGSANAPGAVWSPRIQQFLDDPISKAGLKQGLELQRIEALANGERFNPAELAITGTDEAGNPIIASVPNMRTLDAVKRGLDNMVEGETDKITGKMTQRGKLINDARKSFLGELDRLNPKYEGARAAYGGPMQSRAALARGQQAVTQNPNELALTVSKQSPEQLGQMQLGHRGALMDQANQLRFSTNPFASTLGTPETEARLAALYPGSPGVPNLLRTRDLEEQLARSTNDILGNSKSAQRLIADEQFAGSSLPGAALDVGAGLATGRLPSAGAIARLATRFGDLGRFGVGARAVAKADEAAPLLLDTHALDRMEELLRLQAGQSRVPRYVEGLGTLTGAAFPNWLLPRR